MNCCSTGVLNTEVDNWERGHHDFFVGRQLGQCEDFRYCNHSLAKPYLFFKSKPSFFAQTNKRYNEIFRLEPGHFTSVTLQHAGRDGCKIDWVKLRGSKMQGQLD